MAIFKPAEIKLVSHGMYVFSEHIFCFVIKLVFLDACISMDSVAVLKIPGKSGGC